MYALVLAASLGSPPPERFEVFDLQPRFAVTNHTGFVVTNTIPPPRPTPDPNRPAPSGYEWQRWPGEDWKLVRLAAPGVAASPFAPGPGTTPTTPATGAGPASTTWPGSTGTAPTITFAPGAGTVGGTNCASPFG